MKQKIRRLTEKLTRRMVFRRRLPAAFGRAPLYVSPSAGLAFLLKPMHAVDPALLRSVELVKPGAVVWDIGASVGLFATAAAVRAGPAGKVFAFEPDAFVVDLLRRTSAVQPATSAPLMVIPVAVGRDVELRTLNIAARARAANALEGYGSTQMGGIAERHIVPAVSLDWLLERLPPPDVLKIDIEGAEIELLEDNRMIREVRPVIICEVRSSRKLTPLFAQAGYVLYDGDNVLEDAATTTQAKFFTIAMPDKQWRAGTPEPAGAP